MKADQFKSSTGFSLSKYKKDVAERLVKRRPSDAVKHSEAALACTGRIVLFPWGFEGADTEEAESTSLAIVGAACPKTLTLPERLYLHWVKWYGMGADSRTWVLDLGYEGFAAPVEKVEACATVGYQRSRVGPLLYLDHVPANPVD